ncbi:kinase-like domain-containing protein [Mycena galericulata]|nr:kinase-like domain-containing protein [Mycena galericulata]
MSVHNAGAEGAPDPYKADGEAIAEGRLISAEIFWRDHYSWLKESGYLLRPRYSPGWTPPSKAIRRRNLDIEELVMPLPTGVMDATRLSDGSYVILKRADRLGGPSEGSTAFREVYITQKLSAEPLNSDPKNHCVRSIEILHVPDKADTDLIAIPLLYPWQRFPPSTIGEAVDFFSQVFEGLQFMHNHNIWHGDCKFNSIMMDATPILKYDLHPWDHDRTREYSARAVRPLRSRTMNPVRYYWIDFDLSGEYNPSDGPPLVEPCYGGTHGVPEWAFPERRCNPFAVDVWCLGYMIREYFTEGFGLQSHRKVRGLEFMDDLVADMSNEDPTKRPTMDEVVGRFAGLRVQLSEWKLRSRFTNKKMSVLEVIRSTGHWVQQLYFMAKRIPAIPSQ